MEMSSPSLTCHCHHISGSASLHSAWAAPFFDLSHLSITYLFFVVVPATAAQATRPGVALGYKKQVLWNIWAQEKYVLIVWKKMCTNSLFLDSQVKASRSKWNLWVKTLRIWFFWVSLKEGPGVQGYVLHGIKIVSQEDGHEEFDGFK